MYKIYSSYSMDITSKSAIIEILEIMQTFLKINIQNIHIVHTDTH